MKKRGQNDFLVPIMMPTDGGCYRVTRSFANIYNDVAGTFTAIDQDGNGFATTTDSASSGGMRFPGLGKFDILVRIWKLRAFVTRLSNGRFSARSFGGSVGARCVKVARRHCLK